MDKQRKTWNVKTIAEIAIFSALGYVLDLLAGIYSSPIFPNGGSLGVAMVCVFIISYRRGFLPGLITGLIMGLLDIADGFYVVSGASWYMTFIQVALDYWIAYPLVSLAGIFTRLIKKNSANSKAMYLYIILGCIVGGLAKYMSHVLSGAIFWGSDASSFAWSFKDSGINAWAYSFIYNLAYMGPDIVLSTIVTCVLIKAWPKMLFPEDKTIEEKEIAK